MTARRFPPLEFLKHECDAYSSITALRFFGPYYASQVKELVGSETIGDVVAYFGEFETLEEMIRHVHRCCRNRRAGQTCEKTGQCIDLYHHGAAISLFQLFLFARQNKEYFGDAVLIQICSADLHKVIRAEQKTRGGTDERRKREPPKPKFHKLSRTSQEK